MTHGGGLDGSDPMYWIIAIVGVVGVILTLVFEYFDNMLFEDVVNQSVMDDEEHEIHVKYSSNINSFDNVFRFWTGQYLRNLIDKNHFSNVYKSIALIAAVLWSVGTEFYTANTQGAFPSDHAYGIVSCVANCALWMSCLSATFFSIAVSACKNNAELHLLVNLYGEWLLPIPLIFLLWGTGLLLSQFFIYFHNTVDSGFWLTIAISCCLSMIPLFIHCLHKMGWAMSIVQTEMKFREEKNLTQGTEDIREALKQYLISKPDNVLHYDMEEFIDTIHLPGTKMTTGKKIFAENLFNKQMADFLMIEAAKAVKDTLVQVQEGERFEKKERMSDYDDNSDPVEENDDEEEDDEAEENDDKENDDEEENNDE